jgi:type IV pilus assembly protein PilB
MYIENEYLNCGVNNIDLNSININFSDFKLLTKDIMKKYCVIPVDMDEEYAYVAMGNPEDKEAIQKISFLMEKRICIIPASGEQVYSLISAMEDINNTDLVLGQLKRLEERKGKLEEIPSSIDISFESSPVVKISNSIIEQAINKRASDVHMEPFEENAIIRYRIDGVLHENYTMPKSLYFSICTRMKIEANMDIAEKRIPQDGKIQFRHKNLNYDLRVSTLPTLYGEKLAVRILYREEKLMSLNSLGFDNSGIKNILNCLNSGHGMILATGPTGSGKTTTLYSMINEIDNKHKNIVSIEDPSEIFLKGVNQVNVNNKAGLTFASGLRSILRQDPDVVMVGEIRDAETAQIAVRAAITGHLVLSTLHTNDSASSITRLIDMGVPSYLLADSLIACIAQRLVRKICSFCKSEYKPSEDERFRLEIEPDAFIYQGKGCVFCNNTGYRYRTVVYEMLEINTEIKHLIGSGKGAEEIRNLNIKNGISTIANNGKELVKQGITSYEEFVRLGSVSASLMIG